MGRKITVSLGEGQVIMKVAAGFGITDTFAQEMQLNVAEKAMATQDVVQLYRTLKKQSPMMKGTPGMILFGPADAWEEVEVSNSPTPAFRMLDEDLPVEFRANGEVLAGLRWVLLAMMHPGSGLTLNVDAQDRYGWGVCQKVGLVKQLQKDLGLLDAKRETLIFDSGEDDEEEEQSPSLEKVTTS
jgi:hypothetical protein